MTYNVHITDQHVPSPSSSTPTSMVSVSELIRSPLANRLVSTSPVGRLAPSPSGRMHVGNVFTYMMAWASARSQGGGLVLRIEDLDPRSQKQRWKGLLLEDLTWLGITWTEGPFYQLDRAQLYEEALTQLEAGGYIYPCFCTRDELHVATAPHARDGSYIYRGTCKNLTPQQRVKKQEEHAAAIRVSVPSDADTQGNISFTDMVCGPYHENLAQECGDFLVRRSDGVFAYQLAVVVDDAAMGITEVVRGNDLLSSTPRQIWLQSVLGYPHPRYAHVPLLVAADGRRLSKRDRDLDVGYLRDCGVRPEKLIATLAERAGFIDTADALSMSEFAQEFQWETLQNCPRELVVDESFMRNLGV